MKLILFVLALNCLNYVTSTYTNETKCISWNKKGSPTNEECKLCDGGKYPERWPCVPYDTCNCTGFKQDRVCIATRGSIGGPTDDDCAKCNFVPDEVSYYAYPCSFPDKCDCVPPLGLL